MKNLRIVIVDDHEVVRWGLHTLLSTQTGWEVVGEAANGPEAVRRVNELKPDVVIMDISMPVMSGLEATRLIMETAPQTEVLIFTMHDSEQMVQTALEAGARGYALKSDGGNNLISAVKALSQHEIFVTPQVSKRFPRAV